MLVLPDTYGFRRDFDKLGKRVDETSSYRDGAADCDIFIGKLLAGDVAGGVDRRSVFIDNIDRLDKMQVVEVFRLLSTIADYAGITYILPFDKDFVCSAVEESLPPNQSGSEYISKIVQIPIHLPMLSRSTLDRAFTILLTRLFGEYSIKISKEEIGRFQSLYYYHELNKYLQSPRNINQIINALRFMLPMKLGEVNVVDLIVLEIIRVFDEPFYERIRDSRSMLVQNKNSLSSDYTFDDEYKERKTDIEKHSMLVV